MKLFEWLDRKSNSENFLVLILKIIYKICSNSIVNSIFNVLIPFLFSLPIFINENINITSGIICLIILIIFNILACISEKYKKHVLECSIGASKLINNIQSIFKTYNERITDYEFKGLFEVISDSVCGDLYHFFKDVFKIETRISLVQQYKDDYGINRSVMISRTSAKTQKLGRKKNDSVVKYDGNNSHKYYNNILLDNDDRIVILLDEEINKNFYVKEPISRNRPKIYQYIGIPQKAYGKEIAFLLQIDVMQKNAFGKKEDDIERFCSKYTEPLMQILQNAYLVEAVEQINTSN